MGRKKRMHRALGLRATCFLCGLCFDAEDFAAPCDEKTTSSALHLCVTRGHWRRCNACKTQPPTGEDVVLQCTGLCGQRRSRVHSAEGASVCNAYKLHESKQMHVCTTCNRIKRHDEIDTRTAGAEAYVCYACAPERNLFQVYGLHLISTSNRV